MKLFQKLIKVLKKFKLMLIKFLLNGKEINLTSDDIIIESTNFSVDKNGNMSCKNANMNNTNMNNANMNNAIIEGGNLKMWGNSRLDGVRVFADSSKNTKYMAYMVSNSIGVNSGNDTAEMTPTSIGIGNSIMFKDHITTPSLIQTSLESEKKNFEKFENALEVIKNVDIYKYNLNYEKDTDKKHIGFIIGKKYKYSEELTSKNNDGAEIYSLASCCLQGIKEQQDMIESLQNKVNELEEKIKN